MTANPVGSLVEQLSLLINKLSCDTSVNCEQFADDAVHFKAAADQLESLAEEYNRELSLFTNRQDTASQQFDLLRSSPWLRVPVDLKFVLDGNSTRAFSECSESYRRASIALAEINSYCTRLDEASRRLRRAAEVVVDVSRTPFEEASGQLEAYLRLLDDDLSRISDQEADIAEVCDLLSELTPSDGSLVLSDTTMSIRAALARYVALGHPLTENGRRFEKLCGNLTLASQLIRFAWPSDAMLAKGFVQDLSVAFRTTDLEVAAKLVQFLDYGQVQDIVRWVPESFGVLGCILLRDAICGSNPAPLLFMPSPDCKVFSPSCTASFEAFQQAARRQQFMHAVTTTRRLLTHNGSGNDTVSIDLKSDLLDFIHRPPGLTKYYHALRLAAQQQYLKPLRRMIEASDFSAALKRWYDWGSPDEKYDEILKLSDLHRGIVGSHRYQTIKYLQEFESKLIACIDFYGHSQTWVGDEFSRTIERMLQDTGDAPRLWSRTLQSLMARNGRFDEKPIVDASCTVDQDELLLIAENLVTPFNVLSWEAAATAEPVKFRDFLTDTLRGCLGCSPRTEAAVVEHFLECEKFVAAQKAADEFEIPELQHQVVAAASSRRQRIEQRYGVVLVEASEAREADEYVNLQLEEIKEALDALDFGKACRDLDKLDPLLEAHRARGTPEYLRAVSFLESAGEMVRYGEKLEVLASQMERIRESASCRREHLSRISTFCSDLRVPQDLVLRCEQLVYDCDLPHFWPSEADSASLSLAIEGIARYLRNRMRHGDDVITGELPYWMLNQVESCLRSPLDGRTEMVGALYQIAEDITNPGYPEQRLKETIGVAGTSARPTIRLPDSRIARPEVMQARSTHATPDANPVVHEVRKWLKSVIASDTSDVPIITASRLRALLVNSDFSKAKDHVAALARSESASFSESEIHRWEAIYAICLALESSARHDSMDYGSVTKACLAVIFCDKVPLQLVLPPELLQIFISWCWGSIVIKQSWDLTDKRMPEKLADTMSYAVDLDESGREYADIMALFASAGRVMSNDIDGCTFLAETLWEALKGLKDASRPRSELLILLFRLRRYEAIQHLVQQVASTMQDEMRSCLQVVQRLSADPALYQTAAQRFLALRERSTGKSNTRPWIRFFERMLSVSRQPEDPLTIEVESEYVVPDSDGNLLIEISLQPSAIDPPQVLQLEFSESSARVNLLEAENDFLTGPRVITVTIPKDEVLEAGNQVRISYQIFGRTLLDRTIDLRGSWDLNIATETFEPIDSDRMKRSWPGSTGDPVHADRGFHGREREITRLETYLIDPVRPRSVMLFGQRRIGKTSLLLQMVSTMPPQAGHMCGVFVDLQGLHIPDTRGAMQAAFFQKIIRDIETNAYNELVTQCITGSSGKRLSRIVNDIEPEASLASALDDLVQRISEATNGKIARIAFFIDEFDRFVQPMLTGRSAEVETLLWSLRPIVQQSERISLILAGSGLQRIFTGKYEQAFYGSIDEIEIGTFLADQDRVAIEDTFLPAMVRSLLCSDTHRTQVISRAHLLTGGHPYFLAMLGYSAAQIANGHMLTPALLNRVVEKMVRGDVARVSCQKFYGHIIESLKYLPIEQQVAARIILCRIALQTTSEHPWIKRIEAISDPSFAKMRQSVLLDILRNLAHEGAIETDDSLGRVRIRVPITAVALRHEGDRLRQESVLELEELRSEST